MVASRRISFVALLAPILFLSPSSESLKCNSTNEINGRCYFFFNVTRNEFDRAWAEAECIKRSESTHVWNLPKFDDIDDQSRVDDAISQSEKFWSYWVGLRRDTPVDQKESKNQWYNKSKWRWTVDNTTLKDTFQKKEPPWKSGEPNNRIGSSNDLEKTERCVVAERHDSTTAWYDSVCVIQESASYIQKPFRLVCQSAKATSTPKPTTIPATSTTSTTSTTPTIATTAATAAITSIAELSSDSTPPKPPPKIDQTTNKSDDGLKWQWIFLLSCLGAVLLSAVILLAVCWYTRRRRKSDTGETGGRRSSKSKISNGSASKSIIAPTRPRYDNVRVRPPRDQQQQASISSNKTFTTRASDTDFLSLSSRPSQHRYSFLGPKK